MTTARENFNREEQPQQPTEEQTNGNTSRTRGTVKWFSAAKGYGFIDNQAHPKGVFVHFSEIQGTGYKELKEGQTVEYDIVHSSKGPAAERVVVIE